VTQAPGRCSMYRTNDYPPHAPRPPRHHAARWARQASARRLQRTPVGDGRSGCRWATIRSIVFPLMGSRKAQAYYEAVAARCCPSSAAVTHCSEVPKGIGGPGFMQKNAPITIPGARSVGTGRQGRRGKHRLSRNRLHRGHRLLCQSRDHLHVPTVRVEDRFIPIGRSGTRPPGKTDRRGRSSAASLSTSWQSPHCYSLPVPTGTTCARPDGSLTSCKVEPRLRPRSSPPPTTTSNRRCKADRGDRVFVD
jgi:hypothetical protein